MFKTNSEIIRIEAQSMNEIDTGVVFWSHDRGTAKLVFKLMKNNLPQSLPEGTTVPIRLTFSSSTAEGGIGKHDYMATIEDRINGVVSIVLQDNILGYQGRVKGSIYIDLPNNRSLDTAGRFSFSIKRSPIDDSTPELEDYYFNGFSQTIDKIEKILADGKQEIDQKIAESETQIDGKLKDTNDKITKANQDVATLNTNIDKANDRLDQTNQQIGDLGKLKKMYSNSLDFGDYDYSGNPNLLPMYNFSNTHNNLSTNSTLTDGGTYIKVEKAQNTQPASVTFGFKDPKYITPMLKDNTQYTLTIRVKAENGFIGTGKNVTFRYRYQNDQNATVVPVGASLPNDNFMNDWTEYTFTGTTTDTIKSANPYVHLWIEASAQGTLLIDYQIKLEKGAKSTPFQPNLLDGPYYLSKVALGENIASKSVAFPIVTSDYKLYGDQIQNDWEAGQTYTVTLKGTKPSTQTFNVYLNSGTIGVGTLTPVEGKTDVWQKTFTVTQAHIDGGVTNLLSVYQVPKETAGACKLEWVKLEKAGTATPSISMFKYFGEGLKDSDNPNDYSWDVTPEYTEKGLNDTVSLTEPESVGGVKNFLEQPLFNGTNLAQENFGITLQGGLLDGVSVADGTTLNWGKVYAYDNQRSKTNDLFTISEDTKTLTILKDCALRFIGKFTCQTNQAAYYAYLGMRVNGGSDWRVAGIAGNLNWRNDVGWTVTRGFKAGDRVTLVTGTNYTSTSVNAWGVDAVYIKEVIRAEG